MAKKYLTFDFGASSGRGILAEFSGQRLSLSEIHRFKNDPVFAYGHYYWNLLGLFSEIKTGLAKLYRAGDREIACMGVDTWGVDFALLDQYDKPIQNPLFYRDAFTDGEMERVLDLVPKRELYRRTGIQFMKFNTIFQLSALKRLYPSHMERAKTMLLMPDLLNWMLTGVKSCELSMASTTQLMDVRERQWDFELIDILGLPREIFLGISGPGRILGKTTENIKDETGMRVPLASVCGHDTGSAVLAVPMKKSEKCAYLSCGTWSLLGVELNEPMTGDDAYGIEYTNEAGYGKTVRFLKNIMGLWIYQEIKRELELESGAVSYSELDGQIAAARPFERFIDPDAPEFFEKGNMSAKVALYCEKTGQSAPCGVGETLRCVLESLAFKYRCATERLEGVLGHKIDVIRVVGGGCKDKMLMQFTANSAGRPVIAGPVEATAAGNVCAQLLATGELADIWQARELISGSLDVREYAPEDGGAAENEYARFLKIIGGKA